MCRDEGGIPPAVRAAAAVLAVARAAAFDRAYGWVRTGTHVQGPYSIVALVALGAAGLALLLAARRPLHVQRLHPPKAWAQYRFGFATVALVFLAFDMEMIFMYPWAVVFAELGAAAFLDMLVFIALLAAGIAYAWGMGGLEWE